MHVTFILIILIVFTFYIIFRNPNTVTSNENITACIDYFGSLVLFAQEYYSVYT